MIHHENILKEFHMEFLINIRHVFGCSQYDVIPEEYIGTLFDRQNLLFRPSSPTYYKILYVDTWIDWMVKAAGLCLQPMQSFAGSLFFCDAQPASGFFHT